MKNNLVVKDNALVSASYYLSLAEQRLILLGIVEARNNQSKDNEFIIHVNSYISAFGVDDSTAYLTIKEACKRLRGRYFTYDRLVNGSIEEVESNWIQSIAYATNSSYVKIKFTEAVMPLITNLEKHFTSYQIEQVKDLTSIYSIRLYELLISWKKTKKVELPLADLRLKLGIEPNEYKAMNNFKAKVLDLAITQINQHTDITAKYVQVKTGRQITGFKFSFRQKEKQSKAKELNRDNTTIDFLTDNLTDKQLERIARNKQFISDYNHMITPQSNANNDMNEWVKVMVTKMKTDIKQFNKKPLNDYLK
jgi:plasmid replication initiation protein